MKIKTYDTISTEDMYKAYKSSLSEDHRNSYIEQFIADEQSNGISTKEDFLSLLLSEAIQQEDQELVQNILDGTAKSNYPLILASVDKIQMSPISYALLLDDVGTIKILLKNSLNHGYQFQRVTLTKEAFLKLKDTIEYQGESYQECIDDLVKPICIDQQVEALGEHNIPTNLFIVAF